MSDSYPPGLDPLFGTAVQRILQGEALEPFCDWFAQEMGALMQSELPAPTGEEAEAPRYRRHVARALWQAVPVPSNRWRPRPLAKTERNSPCHCGSGRKYKQCCGQFGSVPLPADADEMLILALSHAEPAMLQPRQLREVPAEALGVAAQAWNEVEPARTVAVLEPLFERIDGLDWRHALAFEALMDALLDLGQENRRQALAQRVAGSRDRELGCTASGRLISMLADRGEEQAAWATFHEAQRKYPDDPALWSLELTLLHAQGRGDEARMRGSMLAAKARRAGLDEAADQLAQLAEQGLAMMFEPHDDELDVDDDELAAWIELCEQVPQRVEAEDCRKLYRLERQAGLPGEPPTLRIRSDGKLAGVERQWSGRFGAGKPMLTQLQGDASALLDALPEAARFLQEQPAAWLSTEVLDDLLLAAADLCAPDSPAAVLQGAKRLASHAVAVLRALVGATSARLEWADADSRAALRVLAQAIALAQQMLDAPAVEQLAGWALELNPNDNHGWRMVLAPQLAGQGRFEEALALMQRYPDDMPPMEHLRSLALFALGRGEEAEQVLRKAHAQYPRIMEYLLPDVIDAPPAETGPGIAVGGAGEAWENRMHTRAAWVRTGALEWARALGLKAPPPAAREATTKKKKKNKAKSADLDTYAGSDESTLRKSFPDYVRLHGFMTAVAWSPDLLQPAQWLQALLALRAEPAAELGTLNPDLEALLRLYNSLNSRVMAAVNDGTLPITDAMTLAGSSDADAFAWAAGFVQGAEAGRAGWRRAGTPVSSDKGAFAALLRLAARAPRTADGWQALDDEGQPMLQGLQDEPTPQETLRLALQDLWRAIAPLRRAT